jgi:ATP-binding cassette, subfamily B, bacterial PglK
MISIIYKLLDLITFQEKKEALLLIFLSILMAIFDVIGVASIMPFMAVLTNPELVESNPILAFSYNSLKFDNVEDFLFFLGWLVFLTLVVSLSFKALNLYMMNKFTKMREYSISQRLFKSYLYQPYKWFLNRHSASLSKTVLAEVSAVIGGALIPTMNLLVQSLVSLALITLLIVADPKLAVVVAGVVGSLYLLIYFLMSNFLSRIGSERVEANEMRYRITSEAFGGIKDIKVGGHEESYLKRFDEPAKIYARAETAASVFSAIPKYFLEMVAFGGIILVILYFMSDAEDFNSVIPIISLYAFAGYRLMPSMQQIFDSAAQLKYANSVLDILHSDVSSLEPLSVEDNDSKPALKLSDRISLKDVDFYYPKSNKIILKKINLEVPAKKTIGIIGATGSGKTTTVDLILGLISPIQGTLKVDDVEVNLKNISQWQKSIGYVPQHIYLADDTIEANIAFGEEPSNIDKNIVELCCSIANLHEFIVNELPEGYATTVGERGVRLSGGQRQRIGIARALYNNPEVLILDEATSALDNITEKLVMDAVHNLSNKITVIIIAHRLSTVGRCDKIYMMEHGQIIDEGTYDSLLITNKKFQKMINQ